MPQAAQEALKRWWETIPVSPVVEDLLHQPDAETISMHDLRSVMDYLLFKTDNTPEALTGISAAILEPLRVTLRLMTQVTARINPVELLVPDQLMEERLNFLKAQAAGMPYEMHFTYRMAVENLKEALRDVPGMPHAENWDTLFNKFEEFHHTIRRLKADVDHPVMEALIPLLHAKVDDDLTAIALAKCLDEEDETGIALHLSRLYTAPSEQDCRAATSLAQVIQSQPALSPLMRETYFDEDHHVTPLLEAEATGEDLRQVIEEAMEMYYAHVTQVWSKPLPSSSRYTIQLDPAFVSFDVRDKSSDGPVICIPDVPSPWIRVFALCRHEIDTHVRQSLNGALLYGLGGGMLKHNEEDLYEGMAMHAEKQFLGEILGLPQIPALPYATIAYDDACQGCSFQETFEHLLSLFPGEADTAQQERAWTIAYRIFRGRMDTGAGLPYGCAKDTGYLRGAILAQQLHANHLGHLLDYGIIPIELLPVHRRFKRDLPLPYPDLNTAKTLLYKHFPQFAHA